MDYLKIIVIALVAGIVGAVGVGFFSSEEQNLGATTARTTITNPWTFSQTVGITGTTTVGRITEGGGVYATTSVAAATLPCQPVDSSNSIQQTNTAVVTITLFASSTCPSTFIPTAGQTKTLYVVNDGNSVITLVGGVGTLLNVATTSQVATDLPIGKTIAGDGTARLDFIRKSNTDIEVFLIPFRQ